MILESEKKDLLYKALSLAQGEFPTIGFNRQAYKNKYADLHALLKPIRHILTKHGLSIHDFSCVINDKHYYGVRLAHESDQYITNIYPFITDDIKQADQKTHKIGGAMTYFFRYYVKGILGLTISDDPDDDDDQPHYEPAPQIMHQKPLAYPSYETITKDQLDQIEFELNGYDDIGKRIKAAYNIKDLSQLPKAKFLYIINEVTKQKNSLPSK